MNLSPLNANKEVGFVMYRIFVSLLQHAFYVNMVKFSYLLGLYLARKFLVPLNIGVKQSGTLTS